ncbi:hypothetical protein M0802_013335 [Mischocyttarus mexicanus]|nr:hypothetical protein M0802_013338 [Mischocyttarus mexicanus]KAI4483495.1 hypothetical protein M0802_013335 [Mischocyttarus mexicanus]
MEKWTTIPLGGNPGGNAMSSLTSAATNILLPTPRLSRTSIAIVLRVENERERGRRRGGGLLQVNKLNPLNPVVSLQSLQGVSRSHEMHPFREQALSSTRVKVYALREGERSRR